MVARQERPDITSFLVAERRSNEAIRAGEPGFIPGEEVRAVIEGLVRQMPNRVYAGVNGRVGRVLFYQDTKQNFRNAAYMQVIGPDQEAEWKTLKGEHLVASNPKAIEAEITRWRSTHGLGADLAQEPSETFSLLDYEGHRMVYGHSLFEGEKKITGYYFISGLEAPYYIGLHRGEQLHKSGVRIDLPNPPDAILQHARTR
jgi:hypothetical protein